VAGVQLEAAVAVAAGVEVLARAVARLVGSVVAAAEKVASVDAVVATG